MVHIDADASITPPAAFDAALPGLAVLGDPPRLAETLAPVLADWLGPQGELVGAGASFLRLVPGKRCTVELDLVVERGGEAPPERRRVLGKIDREGQGARTYQTLRELRQHGFAAGRFMVPEPLAYLPEHHLLLLAWAEGESLRSACLDRSEAIPDIERGAEWLLALHTSGLRSGRGYSFPGHLRTLARWKELLIRVYPGGDRVLADLLARFEERGRNLSGWSPGPTHRDFTPEHLLVDGDRCTGLDLDEFCQYDPLFDVAHFTAHLRFLGLARFGNLRAFDGLAERFQACYEAGGGILSEERLGLYEAIAYFKLGRFVALVPWSKPDLERWPRGWREVLPVLLSEARRSV